MAAPVIADSTRVHNSSNRTRRARTAVRAAQQLDSTAQSPEVLRRVNTGRRRKQRNGNTNQSEHNAAQNVRSARNVLRRKRRIFDTFLPPEVLTQVKRMRAFTVAQPLIGLALSVYPFVLLLWIISIGAIGVESIPIVNWVIPGEQVIIFLYVIIAAISVLFTVGAAVSFLAAGVDCFGGSKLLLFIICAAASATMFINFIPWALIWIGFVIFLQKEGDLLDPKDTKQTA